MHELAIAEGIIETAVPAAERSGAKRILEIRLKVGALSGVFPECVRECLDELSKGTIAEGARLVIEPVPITIRCRGCGVVSQIERSQFKCPVCGSDDFEITGGREYFVDTLEVE